MEKSDIVSRVKSALRISTDNTDIVTEIEDVVDECIELLERKGVVINYDDTLLLKACKTYAKAYYGYEENHEEYQKSFQDILLDLMLMTEKEV